MSAADASTPLAGAVQAVLSAGKALEPLTPKSRGYAGAVDAYAAAEDQCKAVCRTCGPAARLPDALVARIRAAAQPAGPQAYVEPIAAGAVADALLTCAPTSQAAAQARRPIEGRQRRGCLQTPLSTRVLRGLLRALCAAASGRCPMRQRACRASTPPALALLIAPPCCQQRGAAAPHKHEQGAGACALVQPAAGTSRCRPSHQGSSLRARTPAGPLPRPNPQPRSPPPTWPSRCAPAAPAWPGRPSAAE